MVVPPEERGPEIPANVEFAMYEINPTVRGLLYVGPL